jgi:hypothetical protein
MSTITAHRHITSSLPSAGHALVVVGRITAALAHARRHQNTPLAAVKTLPLTAIKTLPLAAIKTLPLAAAERFHLSLPDHPRSSPPKHSHSSPSRTPPRSPTGSSFSGYALTVVSETWRCEGVRSSLSWLVLIVFSPAPARCLQMSGTNVGRKENVNVNKFKQMFVEKGEQKMEKGRKGEGERRDEDEEKANIACLLSENPYCIRNGGKKQKRERGHKRTMKKVLKGNQRGGGTKERGKKRKEGSSVPFPLSIPM